MMKISKLLLLLTVTTLSSHAQTNEEIASVYIKKAEVEYNTQNLEGAKKNFDKAIKLLGNISTNEEIDRLGTLINFQQGKLEAAKKYAKHYFQIAKNKSSDAYLNQLDLYVTIDEKLDSISKVNIAQEQAKAEHLKELKRIEGLKEQWVKLSKNLSLSAEFISEFDKNGIAVYQKNGYYGVLNDEGIILIEANKYKDYRNFDGYILLLNLPNNPTDIFCFVSNTQETFSVPNVQLFSPLSTTYGIVTNPRGNHHLVTYPNNTTKTFVFDLSQKKIIQAPDYKLLFKQLKSMDHIDSYKKDGQVKVNKVWYHFGGSIGSGIYTLYTENYMLYGYLYHIDGKVVPVYQSNHLGAIYQNTIETRDSSNKFSWVNSFLQPVESINNENGQYTGETKVTKTDEGSFQFIRNNKIILEGADLELLKDFLILNHVKKEDLKDL